MRAFDVLTKAEVDVRGSAHPRYHLEMALLRWMHLRKLVPISDLIQGLEQGRRTGRQPRVRRPLPRAAPSASRRAPAPRRRAPPAADAATVEGRRGQDRGGEAAPRPAGRGAADAPPASTGDLKDAFLDEIRKTKKFFYGTVVAQAQRIDVEPDRIVFTFRPAAPAAARQLDGSRAELEALASRLAGREMAVVSAENGAAAPRGRAGDTSVAARRPIVRPNCASRRCRTPACRRCSTCSPPRSRMWKRCE